MKELDAGFLRGPFESEAGVSEFLGCNDWSLSQRFLLLQCAELKPRVIDNVKESAVNAAFGSTSYLALQDVDFVEASCRLSPECCLRAQPLRFA